MSSYSRSDDVSVRKSPSVSATLYQVGTKKTGNDGNLWIIVRDSRGVQRWQKYRGLENKYQESQSEPKIEPKMTNLNDVYEDLRSRFRGGMRLNEEKPDYISCDIRNWGNWEHDYEDYERDEEDFEDDDSMILSSESYKRLKELVNEVSSKYPDVKIAYSTSEKNYIDFEIYRKPIEKPVVENIVVEEKVAEVITPKTEDQFLNGIKKSIEGLKILIEDEPELKPTIEEKVKKRIDGLDILAEDGDESAVKAAKIMRDFLKESFKFGGKIKKREEDEQFYENALRNAKRQSDREYFIKKLNELDNKKVTFYN
jgi:hypothetical protein